MRIKHSVGYFSSYDRGLNYLLDMWPDIRQAVPDATLSVYYGWNSYDNMHSHSPEQMKWKYQMIRKIHDLKSQGVAEFGRVNHQELAKAMRELEVWAYPTGFPEINCITAIKCGASGMIPITTGYAALQETVLEPQHDWGEAIYDEVNNKDVLTDFKARLIKALQDGRPEAERQAKATEYIDKFSWDVIAQAWDKCASA